MVKRVQELKTTVKTFKISVHEAQKFLSFILTAGIQNCAPTCHSCKRFVNYLERFLVKEEEEEAKDHDEEYQVTPPVSMELVSTGYGMDQEMHSE